MIETTTAETAPERIVSKREFADRVGWAIPTLERRENEARRDGLPFPKRRLLGHGLTGRVGYLLSEVNSYLRNLPVGNLTARTAPALKALKVNREARAKKPVRR